MSIFYIFTFIYNFCFLILFKRISKILNIFDEPNQKRKIHKIKIANIGGVIIFSNLFFIFLFSYFINDFKLIKLFSTEREFIVFLFFSLIFFLVGILDDKYDLNANYKFLIFCCLTYLIVSFDNNLVVKNIDFSFTSKIINIENISIFFTILAFLLFINAFNMFDGINLLASVYSLFLFSVFFFRNVYPSLCIILIISILFFSFLNFKNKCFFGNSGSYLIAFIICYFSIKSANNFKALKADEIFLMMLIPGVDLLRLTINRILYKKNPFSADRNHFHHLLLNKYKFTKTLFIILSLIILPNLISLILGYSIYLILFTLIIYSYLINKSHKLN
jgi:UDP-GlcNAc:undecaprenyl-phosphate GlcNAc-1-phosphate transferase